jgi:hypothetical protein
MPTSPGDNETGPQRPNNPEKWLPGKGLTGERMSEEETAVYREELQAYYEHHFRVGDRYKLTESFFGIPKGACCTVVWPWPNTAVRWDKWSEKGYGTCRYIRYLDSSLDNVLEYIGYVGDLGED